MAGIFKKMPFVVSVLAFINVLTYKIIEYVGKNGDHELTTRIITFIFDPGTPFYFNYWLAYIALATIIAIVFALLKKYSVWETVVGIGSNLLLFAMMLIMIIKRM